MAVGKPKIVMAVDESEHSFYALEWTLDHFFTAFGSDPPYELVIVHARPDPPTILGLTGPASVGILPIVEADLKKAADRVVQKAKELCRSKSVNKVTVEVIEGDPRNVACDAADRHQPDILILGSHGYGAVKRAVLGSVSDYCAHHAHCSVMIVKKPKH